MYSIHNVKSPQQFRSCGYINISGRNAIKEETWPYYPPISYSGDVCRRQPDTVHGGLDSRWLSPRMFGAVYFSLCFPPRSVQHSPLQRLEGFLPQVCWQKRSSLCPQAGRKQIMCLMYNNYVHIPHSVFKLEGNKPSTGITFKGKDNPNSWPA